MLLEFFIKILSPIALFFWSRNDAKHDARIKDALKYEKKKSETLKKSLDEYIRLNSISDDDIDRLLNAKSDKNRMSKNRTHLPETD